MSPNIVYAKAQVDPGWTVVEAINEDFTVSLFDVFGSPTEPGKFLYIIPSGFEIGGNDNSVPYSDNQFARALATSKSFEPLFPTGSRIRVWVKPGAFIRGGGGQGGFGGCENLDGQDEKAGGGGGGAGFTGRRIVNDPFLGGGPGINGCAIFDSALYGGPGIRTAGGLGNTTIKFTGGSFEPTSGDAGTAAVWLRESIEILNEGSIWGGGGGGGGGNSSVLGNRAVGGDGGDPGEDGEDGQIISGSPAIGLGGALGEGVIQESGATVTWISNHPEGAPGSPNDVLGGII